jgi:peptidyl-prolyl cis-trans isomerase C
MKLILTLVAVLALIHAVPAVEPKVPAKAAAPALFADKVVAKGKGLEIKASQLDEIYLQIKAQAAGRGQPIPDEQGAQVRQRILDQMIVFRLLGARADKADHAKAETEAREQYLKFRDSLPNESLFTAQLQSLGMTTNGFRAQIIERQLAMAVIDREVRGKVVITDAQVKKFYDESSSRFEEPERVRASHILISSVDAATRAELPAAELKKKKETADKVLARAKKGEDFAKLAKEFSEDPGSKETGGEYTFPRGQMVKEFEETAFALKANEVSGLVKTQFGWHIIKLSEKMPAKKLAFDEVKADLKKALIGMESDKQIPPYLDQLKKDAAVEVLLGK